MSEKIINDETQKAFKKKLFGGFSKDDVTEYIGKLMEDKERELSEGRAETEKAKAETDDAKSQLAEFKNIVEDQYQKIVLLTAERDELLKTREENLAKLEKVSDELRVYTDSKIEAKAMIDKAKGEVSAQEAKLKEHLQEAGKQIRLMSEQANDKANALLIPARREAEQLVRSANARADEILQKAKAQSEKMLTDVQAQIENTITLSEENEERARRLVDSARREAEETVKNAKNAAQDEKQYYDKCLRELENQRTRLISSIDDVKKYVQNLEIVKSDAARGERQSGDLFRRKFNDFGSKGRQGDKPRN